MYSDPCLTRLPNEERIFLFSYNTSVSLLCMNETFAHLFGNLIFTYRMMMVNGNAALIIIARSDGAVLVPLLENDIKIPLTVVKNAAKIN